jgi:hypothetical protein
MCRTIGSATVTERPLSIGTRPAARATSDGEDRTEPGYGARTEGASDAPLPLSDAAFDESQSPRWIRAYPLLDAEVLDDVLVDDDEVLDEAEVADEAEELVDEDEEVADADEEVVEEVDEPVDVESVDVESVDVESVDVEVVVEADVLDVLAAVVPPVPPNPPKPVGIWSRSTWVMISQPASVKRSAARILVGLVMPGLLLLRTVPERRRSRLPSRRRDGG